MIWGCDFQTFGFDFLDFGLHVSDSRLYFRLDRKLDESQDKAKVAHAFYLVIYEVKCMSRKLPEQARQDKARHDKISETYDQA